MSMGFFQPLHLLMLFILLLIFGPLILPELGARLGKVIRELVSSVSRDKMVAVLDQEDDIKS